MLIGTKNDEKWENFLSLLPELDDSRTRVGLDLEANGLHRYKEQICLVQMCQKDEVYLVDPLGEADLRPVADWLSAREIWMHGADYDMALMLMDWGILPQRILDTQIAAQLLGFTRFGYASLVEEVFEVELSKSSQKADWGRRPLPEKMLEYAKNDVRYLLPLAAKLQGRLQSLGRDSWFRESCGASMTRVLSRSREEREHWRINGAGKLKPKELNFLRAVWQWRDGEAADWNRPPFMVTGNKQLIAWAADGAAGRPLKTPPKMRPKRVERLHAAVEKAAQVPSEEWPQHPKRERHKKDKTFDKRLKLVMDKRDKEAEDLGIASSVIAPRAALEAMVGGRGTPEELLLEWQRKLLLG